MTYIYTLSDPITGQIRYVGKTQEKQYKRRLYQHQSLSINTKKKGHVCSWIISLLKKGHKPIMEIIDKVDTEYWEFWEQHYISLFRSWGYNLCNLTDGGNGVYGYKWTEEAKKNHSERLKGKNTWAKGSKKSEEFCLNISKITKKRGCHHLLKYRKDRRKQVLQICLKTKVILNKFNSITEAELSLNVKGIKSSLNKENRLSGKYKWVTQEFYDSLENKEDIFNYTKPKSSKGY